MPISLHILKDAIENAKIRREAVRLGICPNCGGKVYRDYDNEVGKLDTYTCAAHGKVCGKQFFRNGQQVPS